MDRLDFSLCPSLPGPFHTWLRQRLLQNASLLPLASRRDHVLWYRNILPLMYTFFNDAGFSCLSKEKIVFPLFPKNIYCQRWPSFSVVFSLSYVPQFFVSGTRNFLWEPRMPWCRTLRGQLTMWNEKLYDAVVTLLDPLNRTCSLSTDLRSSAGCLGLVAQTTSNQYVVEKVEEK